MSRLGRSAGSSPATPALPSAGDPASPAPAAQHGGPVPAADVRSPAAAPHAADGGPTAAAPQQRPAPEPRGRAAGKTTSQERRRCPRRKGQEKQALHACAHASSQNHCKVGVIITLSPLTDEERGSERLSASPEATQLSSGAAGPLRPPRPRRDWRGPASLPHHTAGMGPRVRGGVHRRRPLPIPLACLPSVAEKSPVTHSTMFMHLLHARVHVGHRARRGPCPLAACSGETASSQKHK